MSSTTNAEKQVATVTQNQSTVPDRIRIVDIAESLGVSTATVSNVIHGKTKKISAKTVEMVQRRLEETGYIPNMAATLLAQNDSHIIGVVIHEHEKYEGHIIEDPFIASSINELSHVLDASGYFMMIKTFTEIRQAAAFASMWNMDGMVLLGFCEDDYFSLRNEIHIPFVVYDGFFENKGRICNLSIDDFDGGRQVGEYFHKLGHRRVLCMADNDILMDQLRFEGFCAGFYGVDGSEDDSPSDGFGADADTLYTDASHKNISRSGTLCADRMLIPMQRDERVRFLEMHLAEIKTYSAIFAVSDYYAVEIMQFLMCHGVAIPNEISVAGFDGSPLCRQVYPSLTSVRQDSRERAVLAVKLLERMKQEPEYAEDVLLAVELVAGDSTGSCSCGDF